MKRVSDESGEQAGMRNVGRFFLFAIPLVLGLGAASWFGLWVSGHNFNQQKEAEKHELTQQERSAVYTGAGTRPTGKLAVQLQNKSCISIVRADVDTKKKGYPYEDSDYDYSLILYGQNNCGRELHYVSWHWQMLSPNGTLIEAGYTNLCAIPGNAEIAECSFRIDRDERADKFRVWAQDTP